MVLHQLALCLCRCAPLNICILFFCTGDLICIHFENKNIHALKEKVVNYIHDKAITAWLDRGGICLNKQVTIIVELH